MYPPLAGASDTLSREKLPGANVVGSQPIGFGFTLFRPTHPPLGCPELQARGKGGLGKYVGGAGWARERHVLGVCFV